MMGKMLLEPVGVNESIEKGIDFSYFSKIFDLFKRGYY